MPATQIGFPLTSLTQTEVDLFIHVWKIIIFVALDGFDLFPLPFLLSQWQLSSLLFFYFFIFCCKIFETFTVVVPCTMNEFIYIQIKIFALHREQCCVHAWCSEDCVKYVS